MSALTADRLAVINDIPQGDSLILPDIGWEEYEDLINRLGDDSHLRVSYSDGILEVMSPSTPHEKYKSLIDRLVVAIGYEWEIDVLSFGSFTMKIDRLRKGAEADDSFYRQHAAAMIGRDYLELGVDPPPDMVVEIDVTRDSRKKFDIYASFGTPEIWRYDGIELSIFQLIDGKYRRCELSACFPSLSSARLTELLSGASSQTHRARKSLHNWLRAYRPSDSSNS